MFKVGTKVVTAGGHRGIITRVIPAGGHADTNGIFTVLREDNHAIEYGYSELRMDHERGTGKWTITLNGRRSTVPVKGQITLHVEAETREDAEALAKDSLPGFDWTGWTTLFGVEEEVYEINPTREAEGA